MNKIIILGGAGFIGLNLAKQLLKNSDNQITIVDNFFRGKMDDELKSILSSKISIIEADLTIPEEYQKFTSQFDQVYLLASMVGVEYVEKIPHEILRVNTSIILNTLEWMKSSKSKKILFTSTSECYAGAIDMFNYSVPTDEKVPMVISDVKSPRFTYALTKMFGESVFIQNSKFYNFECTIVRYHNVYGPRMGFKHVIPQMVERFYKNENPFKIYGANQTRSFNYIDDAVEGTILAMNKPNTNCEIFHIGDEYEITITELAQFIGNETNYKGNYVNAENHAGSVNRRRPDIEKAKNQLEYKPKTHWKEGIKTTVEWYVNYFRDGQTKFE